jgi:hypothetical protein
MSVGLHPKRGILAHKAHENEPGDYRKKESLPDFSGRDN